MTEKQPELKSIIIAEETVSDRTLVDLPSPRADESQEPPPSDPDPLAFDPGKFSRIVIPMELRKEMAQAKPPRLGPEFFQDTQPPNKGLQAPVGPPVEDAITEAPKRRAPLVIVALCLFGAVFVLALALFRFVLSKRQVTPTPTPTSATELPPPPARTEPSIAVAPTVPTVLTPSTVSSAAVPPAPPKGEPNQPPPVATPSHPKSAGVSKPSHSASATEPPNTSPPPATTASPTPTAGSTTPAPARTSWFHK